MVCAQACVYNTVTHSQSPPYKGTRIICGAQDSDWRQARAICTGMALEVAKMEREGARYRYHCKFMLTLSNAAAVSTVAFVTRRRRHFTACCKPRTPPQVSSCTPGSLHLHVRMLAAVTLLLQFCPRQPQHDLPHSVSLTCPINQHHQWTPSHSAGTEHQG